MKKIIILLSATHTVSFAMNFNSLKNRVCETTHLPGFLHFKRHVSHQEEQLEHAKLFICQNSFGLKKKDVPIKMMQNRNTLNHIIVSVKKSNSGRSTQESFKDIKYLMDIHYEALQIFYHKCEENESLERSKRIQEFKTKKINKKNTFKKPAMHQKYIHNFSKTLKGFMNKSDSEFCSSEDEESGSSLTEENFSQYPINKYCV